MTPLPIYQSILSRDINIHPALDRPDGREVAKTFCAAALVATKLDARSVYGAFAARSEIPEGGEQRHANIEIDTFPQCLPPWLNSWVEWTVSNAETSPGGSNIRHEAALVSHAAKDTPDFMEWWSRCEDKMQSYERCDDTADLVLIQAAMSVDDIPRILPFTAVVALDKIGTHIGAVEFRTQDAGLQVAWPSLLQMPLFSFALSNCRNIITEEKRERISLPGCERFKKKGRQFYRYHVLKIDGAHGGHHESKGGDGETPLHLCRGHFKHYTPEAPRFGRDVGVFWCPSHVRGNAKYGVVEKDYQLAGAPETFSAP